MTTASTNGYFELTCPVCGKVKLVRVAPWHHCGQRIGEEHAKPPDPRGFEKAAICRSNRCGYYDEATDTCGILTQQNLAGSIKYLYSRPWTRCVAEEPLF